METSLGRRPEPEHVVAGGRRGTEEPAWMVRDTWAMGLRAAIQLCDSCIGRWLRMRPPGDEDEREDDPSAFAAAMAGSRAVDRAWTGMAVREAMMVEPQVPRKEVVRNDARRALFRSLLCCSIAALKSRASSAAC